MPSPSPHPGNSLYTIVDIQSDSAFPNLCFAGILCIQVIRGGLPRPFPAQLSRSMQACLAHATSRLGPQLAARRPRAVALSAAPRTARAPRGRAAPTRGWRAAVVVRADLMGAADSVLMGGALALGAGAALLAVFADPLPPARVKENQEASFRWGIMGAIACLPLFNWLAWVFAALEEEGQARYYYGLAALYALPLLRTGFDLDAFAVALLAVGAAHVQAERIAATEPETQASVARALSPLSILKTAVTAARAAAGALFGAAPAPRRAGGAGGALGGGAGASGGRLPAGTKRAFFGEDVQKTRDEELEEALREEELKEFDRRMQEREAARRRGGAGARRP
ncbi:MAG: hypothetical protein J3K34DRAFT_521893 [Monoraphidium minutum]|nr:MAG: hypothetical protein J3K34DRAFT_521893 [Monoraphidium minutum]